MLIEDTVFGSGKFEVPQGREWIMDFQKLINEKSENKKGK